MDKHVKGINKTTQMKRVRSAYAEMQENSQVPLSTSKPRTKRERKKNNTQVTCTQQF